MYRPLPDSILTTSGLGGRGRAEAVVGAAVTSRIGKRKREKDRRGEESEVCRVGRRIHARSVARRWSLYLEYLLTRFTIVRSIYDRASFFFPIPLFLSPCATRPLPPPPLWIGELARRVLFDCRNTAGWCLQIFWTDVASVADRLRRDRERYGFVGRRFVYVCRIE